MVGFRGSPAPRGLVTGARVCAKISPFISHESLIQWLFRDFQDAILEFIQIPFIIVKVIKIGLEIYERRNLEFGPAHLNIL